MSLLPGQRVFLEKDGQWLDRTQSISRLRHDGKLIRVTFRNGRTFNYGQARVKIVTAQNTSAQNTASQTEAKSPRTYLTELADAVHNVEDSGEGAADGLALRPKLEKMLPIPKTSILGSFLTGEAMRRPRAVPRPVIAPWATNVSQLTALHAANAAPVSVIQGPPGTGKTQTILALIANALVHGESVAVVSSNNTAVDNVKTKLEEAGLDFLTARLGSMRHREEFIESQSARIPPHVLDWVSTSAPQHAVIGQAAHSVHQLGSGLTAINEIAQLRHEHRALVTEWEHFGHVSADESGPVDRLQGAVAGVSSAEYLRAVLSVEQGEQSRWRAIFSWFKFKRRATRQLIAAVSPQARREIWYEKRLAELDVAIGQREGFLKAIRWETLSARAGEQSLQALRAAVALRRGGKRERAQFTSKLWGKEAEFLHEYPVVFSTMQSLPGTFRPGFKFDWVIVDEASQASLLTGVLAMSCAERIVVVGDEQQLPRVLPTIDEKRALEVENRYSALLGKSPWLSYVNHSFLGAVFARWGFEIPVTLLREHYRCAPLIAGFINQRFYGGQLQIMTKDDDAHPQPIQVTLGQGKSWDNVNRHQVEEIVNQISRGVGEPDGVGVIAPYRNQVSEVRARVSELDPLGLIEIDTVHAFQGREKPVVILTTVDGAGDFVNEPRLVNVAVSRAQKSLILVADEKDEAGAGLIGDLIRYVRYHDVSAISQSDVRSVFELLAAAQAPLLAQLRSKRGATAQQESPAEAIVANLLNKLLIEPGFETFEFVQEYALIDLVGHSNLTMEERGLAERGSRVDFLIYNGLDKKPVGVIEVDGATYHRRGSAQAQRDALKDSALERAGIPILRLPTDGAGEIEKVRAFLADAKIASTSLR